MDLRTVLTISTLLLMTAESNQTALNSTNSTTGASSTRNCSCNSSLVPADCPTPTTGSNSPAPALRLLRIQWNNKDNCKGVVLISYNASNFQPICHSSKINVKGLFEDVCKNKKGCKGPMSWGQSTDLLIGSYITENGITESICEPLRVQCKAEVLPDLQGQLKSYKVVTALLCCVLLVLLLLRFTRPTVKALQKRLSDRRQNRWIGPTQSHSVSYHRGKTAVKNNDGEKRLSYPALERLAVSESREPSSNRNSDYNF